MEETQPAKGAACRNDDDAVVDLDVSLSYIDEKLQNVLGHLQKDFEGGVSSQKLGTRFGGYGSFLPQRSPISSHQRSPRNYHNQNQSSSPNSFHHQVGGAHHNSALPANVPLPVQYGPKGVGNEHPLLGNRGLSTREEVDIRSDIGLYISPSFEDSPTESENPSIRS